MTSHSTDLFYFIFFQHFTFIANLSAKSLLLQIAKSFPGLMMKLLVKTANNPLLKFEPDKVTVQVNATVTAYAIQANSTLSPLFILNLVGYKAGILKGHLCASEKTLKPSYFIVFIEVKCQCPSLCQWHEAGWSCHP